MDGVIPYSLTGNGLRSGANWRPPASPPARRPRTQLVVQMTFTYVRDARDVIHDWREVTRDLERVDPTSPEAVRLDTESQRLQDEYFRLGEEAFRKGDSLPFPRLK